jgi:hypothetical protein
MNVIHITALSSYSSAKSLPKFKDLLPWDSASPPTDESQAEIPKTWFQRWIQLRKHKIEITIKWFAHIQTAIYRLICCKIPVCFNTKGATWKPYIFHAIFHENPPRLWRHNAVVYREVTRYVQIPEALHLRTVEHRRSTHEVKLISVQHVTNLLGTSVIIYFANI